jgi:hypothetical protein
MKKNLFTIGILLVAVLFSACAAPSTVSPSAGSSQPSGNYQGMPSATVDGYVKDVETALSAQDTKITQTELKTIFPTLNGWSQAITFEGTGKDFGGLMTVASKIEQMLTGKGWVVENQLAANGPTGLAAGYHKDKGLAIIVVDWKPAADVQVDMNKPIESQNIPPEKQVFTVKLVLATLP